ncbi:MAG TPA: CYCXC family (seleno)protein, partial [Gemmatimonadales bacterium]|nr:CYCXC family (seleno)protein [Gemmatimonadales bacterium]
TPDGHSDQVHPALLRVGCAAHARTPLSAKRLPWIVAGAAIHALVLLVAIPRRGTASIHQAPRPGITADSVVPQAMVMHTPGAAESYAVARQIPQVLDGLYCHCDCSKHMQHRSLLTCFTGDHAAQCDICMGEAMLAGRMAAAGNSLDQIRKAIDEQFGTTRS